MKIANLKAVQFIKPKISGDTRMNRLFIALAIALVSDSTAAWSLFGPSNYDDCVLENVKGAQSQQAVIAIKRSCSEKFKKKNEIKEQELPDQVLQNLEGRAGFHEFETQSAFGGREIKQSNEFSGSILNSNAAYAVTKIVVRITDNNSKKYNDYSSELFVVGVNNEKLSGVSPHITGKFHITTIESPEDMSWSLIKAYGYEIKQ